MLLPWTLPKLAVETCTDNIRCVCCKSESKWTKIPHQRPPLFYGYFWFSSKPRFYCMDLFTTTSVTRKHCAAIVNICCWPFHCGDSWCVFQWECQQLPPSWSDRWPWVYPGSPVSTPAPLSSERIKSEQKQHTLHIQSVSMTFLIYYYNVSILKSVSVCEHCQHIGSITFCLPGN